MSEIIIIAAMAENRVIGKNNVIPWSVKEDMARFRQLTSGWPCVMGRKTWESLPKKPLPGRLNVIISGKFASSVPAGAAGELCPRAKTQALSPSSPSSSSVPLQNLQNVIIAPSLPAAIESCASHEKIFICGGESIYRQALSLADKIELTLIHGQYEGDTFFPEIDSSRWTAVNTVSFDNYSFITYIKNRKEL